MISAPGLDALIVKLAREDRGRLLSLLISKFRNFDLAEEALQDALISAHEHWGRVGPPSNPQAWLLTVASRKALDRVRKLARQNKVFADIAIMSSELTEEGPDIADERLRLIFTCCHPALDKKSRVALTLRTLGGLTTSEIAKSFLDTEATMGQRLTRAKAKIADAGIPYKVPEPHEWPERLNSVLVVIYLIFNAGYHTGGGETPLRRSLCEEAIFLARMLNSLRPQEPEILGLLALMLTIDARSKARFDADSFVPLEEQNPNFWDRAMLAEADAILEQAMKFRSPGPFQIQAAIAALHSEEGTKDWQQIVLLYDSLIRIDGNPVIRLNRAVALAEAGFIEPALNELALIQPELADYQPFYAAMADLLVKANQIEEANVAFDTAIKMASNDVDRTFLQNRKAAIQASLRNAD